MIRDNQIFVVVDIEADGPMPGLYSMLSLAAVATTSTKEIARFYRKLEPLDGTLRHESTMRWWDTQPDAWQEVNTDAKPPKTVVEDFCKWVKALELQPVFVSSPIALDYTFVGWYLHKFTGENPFSDDKNAVRTLDLRSFIAGKYGLDFDASSRTRLPASLLADIPDHTHRAIDDAVGYAVLLRKVLGLPGLDRN